jgi:hypothetical protein
MHCKNVRINNLVIKHDKYAKYEIMRRLLLIANHAHDILRLNKGDISHEKIGK